SIINFKVKMGKIKYSTQKLDFSTDLRNSVNEYFKSKDLSPFGNKQIIVKTIFVSMLYLIPFVLLISGIVDSVILVMACWILMGLGMSGMGMVTMHDANH